MTTPTDKPKRAAAPPVTAEKRAQVIELHGQGMSRNGIAREVGISGAAVTKICKQEGLSFDREATMIAIRARQIDLAVEREEIKRMLLVRARESLEAMDAPTVVYSFGGRENTYAEHLLDAPPIRERQSLMTTAAIAVQRFAELDRVDQGMTGTREAGAMLERLRDSLTLAVDGLNIADTDLDPTITPDRAPSSDSPDHE